MVKVNKFALSALTSCMQGAVALIYIRYINMILPRELGKYSLLMALIACCVSLSENGSNFLIYSNWNNEGGGNGGRLERSVLILNMIIGAVSGISLVITLVFLREFIGVQFINSWTLLMTAMVVITICINKTLSPIIIIKGKSYVNSICALANSTIMVITLAVIARKTDLTVESLVVATTLGQIISLIIGFRESEVPVIGKIDYRLFSNNKRIVLSSWLSQNLDDGVTLITRTILTAMAGLNQTGLYANALIYQTILHRWSNVISEHFWPKTLQGLRKGGQGLGTIMKIWTIYYAIMGCLLVSSYVFVAFGWQTIILGDKYKEVVILLPIIIVTVIIQNSGKLGLAALYEKNRGDKLSQYRISSLILTVVIVAIMVGSLKAIGCAVAVAAGQLVYRNLIYWKARKDYQIKDPTIYAGWISFGSLVLWLIVK